MTIQLIDTVTPDVGLKTVADKLNANFTNADHAASKLVGTAAGEVPTNADLPTFGTAATADVQTSPTDTTAGALMAVGAYGIASELVQTETDFDAAPYNISGCSLISALSSSMTNAPSDSATAGRYAVSMIGGQIAGRQTAVNRTTGIAWSRSIVNGVWSSTWQPVYTGSNYQPAVRGGLNTMRNLINNTGAVILPDQLVSGSLLNEFITDTNGVVLGFGAVGTAAEIYKCMASFSLADNAIGYFTRVS